MNKEAKGGLFEILDKIKARPGMYIGRPSVSDLFIFLVGYKTARRELGVEPTESEIEFYDKFHEFVEEKYHLHTSNSWAKIIMLYCPDEQAGFEHFFNLFDEFQRCVATNPVDSNARGDEEIASVTRIEMTKQIIPTPSRPKSASIPARD